MKKFKWIAFAMLAAAVLLAGCNQAEEQEEPADDNADEEQPVEQAEEEAEEQFSAEDEENEQLISMAETFIDQLNEGKYEEATKNFDETMSELLAAEDLEELWVSLNSQIGEFLDQEYTTTEEADGHQVVLITGVFNDADVMFQVTFDENEQIAGFYVQ